MRKLISVLLVISFMMSALAPAAVILDSAEVSSYADAENTASLHSAEVEYASAKQNKTFELGEGTWTITDDGGTGAKITGNSIVADGYSGIVTVTDGETERKIHLVGGTKWKPGLNFLTGTIDVIDITHENGSFVVGENADIRNVSNQTAASKNPVGQFETNYGYHWFPIEEMSFDRNILIKFDFAGASNTTRLVVNGGNEGRFWYDFGSNSGNRAIWDSYKYDGKAGSNATSNYSSLNKLGFVICWSGYVEGYFDNYAFIPFYKITYTGIGDEYFLYDENGDIAVEYKVDTSKTLTNSDVNFEFMGWSTEENSTEAMSIVELNNEDVILYPVWKLKNAVEYELSVEGTTLAEITADENTYAYTSVFSAVVPDTSVTWSVDDDTVATIDENGVLTPLSEGTVKVTAKANYYPYKNASMTVEVKYPENAEFVNVSFEGDVLALPDDIKLLKGAKLKTDKYMNMISSVSGKRFNGWLLDGELIWDNPVIDKDTVLTALINDDYNFAVSGHISDWKYNAGAVTNVDNSMYCSYSATHTDPYITNDSLNINIPEYQAIEYYIDVNYKEGGTDKILTAGQDFEGTYFARTGEGIVWQRQVRGSSVSVTGDGRYAVVRCDMHKNAYWEGTLETIRFDFLGNGKYEFAVRYIKFVPRDEFENKTIEIDGIDAPVTGMIPDTSATLKSDDYSIKEIKWTGGDFLSGGQFDEDISYTVEITLESNSKTSRFAKDSTALINGKEAEITANETGGAVVKYTFDKTEVLVDFEFEIDGADVVTRNDRSFKYGLVFTSEEEVPNKEAYWSVDKPEYAFIDEATGELKAKKNGEIVITAVSAYNPMKSVSKNVVISGIDDTPFKITYHPGTADVSSVRNMPEEETTNEKILSLYGKVPEREGYIFLGWSTDENSIVTTEQLILSDNVNLYAVWGKGINFEFNGETHGAKPASSSIEVNDTYLKVTTDSKQLDARLELAGLSVNPSECTMVEVKMAVDTASDVELYFGPDNAGITWQNAIKQMHGLIGLDNYQIYTFDFSNMTGWTGANRINTLWLDPFQSYSTEAHIDYIRALDYNRTISLNPTGGAIDGEASVKAVFGQRLSVPQIPEKDGYVFLGWSKEVDGDVLPSVFVNDDISLYAVWATDIKINEEDNSVAEAVSITGGSDSVILVNTLKNTNVVLTYKDAEGRDVRASEKANANGYAVFDISGKGALTDVRISSGSKIKSASVTSKETADSIANKVHETVSSGTSSGSSTEKDYDMTVETVKNENKAYNTESGIGSVENELVSSEEIFFGFDSAYEKGLFTLTQNASLKHIKDSVITYNVLPKGTSGKVNAELSMPETYFDADSHRYVVVRARGFGLENPILRILYRKEFEEFSNINSVRNTLTDEYQILVYDMTKAEDWNGIIAQFKFELAGNSSGAVDIDWVLFTDTIPENTDAYNVATDKYEVTLKEEMSFADVKENDWFYGEVLSAYKRGLVNGKGENIYDPEGNVTIAEAITLAVRLNLMYNGEEALTVSDDGKWYSKYVNKALELGIICENEYSDYDAPILRKEVASIMAKALPDEYVNPINVFDEVPDISSRDRSYRSVMKLYRAGIFTGSDEAYNFLPETGITRAEMAAVVVRLAVPSARKRIYTEAEREANKVVYSAEEILSGVSKSVSLDGYILKDGMATFVSKTKDPTVMMKKLFGTFDGSNVSKITIGVKWDTEKAKPALQLFFLTPGDNWNENDCIRGVVTDTDENGIMNVEFNVSIKKEFRTMIEELRFDPFDVEGAQFGIAYIIVE